MSLTDDAARIREAYKKELALIELATGRNLGLVVSGSQIYVKLTAEVKTIFASDDPAEIERFLAAAAQRG